MLPSFLLPPRIGEYVLWWCLASMGSCCGRGAYMVYQSVSLHCSLSENCPSQNMSLLLIATCNGADLALHNQWGCHISLTSLSILIWKRLQFVYIFTTSTVMRQSETTQNEFLSTAQCKSSVDTHHCCILFTFSLSTSALPVMRLKMSAGSCLVSL